ncbi:hypothetical protein AVEN_172608-1, partial [Araneus ventricosus]
MRALRLLIKLAPGPELKLHNIPYRDWHPNFNSQPQRPTVLDPKEEAYYKHH